MDEDGQSGKKVSHLKLHSELIGGRVELQYGVLLDPKLCLTCQIAWVLNCVEHEQKHTLKRRGKDQS